MTTLDPAALEAARLVLDHEAQSLRSLHDRLDDRFAAALQLAAGCTGTVIVTGLGKSGLIGAKISATLASTGTHSIFLHATEALHGDAGRLRPGDVVVAMSQSGTTAEVLEVCAIARRRGVPVVAVTGAPAGPLAQCADAILDTSIDHEADPLDLVPTSSTTLALAIGDALAIGLMTQRGMTAADFAEHHPGGALGRRLAPGPQP